MILKKTYYSISEVSKLLNIQEHTIRFWNSKLPDLSKRDNKGKTRFFNVKQIEKLIGLGVEKVAIGSAAIENPKLIEQAARRVGSQSIVGVLDVKKVGVLKRPEIVFLNGSKRTGSSPKEVAISMQNSGVGEILLQSVDRDGTMLGYDIDLIDRIKGLISVPLTVLGGSGSYHDIKALTERYPVIGVAAGSVFVFKGKYRAVMIDYYPHPS